MARRNVVVPFSELPTNDGRDYAAVVARLEHIFNSGEAAIVAAGASWYADRHAWLHSLSALCGVSAERLAYVASALSPNTRWSKNETALLAHIAAYMNGASDAPRSDTLYGTSDTKAWLILNGAPLSAIGNGEKTLAFAPNLLEREFLPDGKPAVTVDSIYHQAATGVVPKNGISVVPYRTIRRATLYLAKKYGLAGHVFQAIVWCIYRGRAD